jgi:hypothetical protein
MGFPFGFTYRFPSMGFPYRFSICDSHIDSMGFYMRFFTQLARLKCADGKHV